MGDMCRLKTFIVGLRQGQSGKVVEMAACNQREPYEELQSFREEGLLPRLPGGPGLQLLGREW